MTAQHLLLVASPRSGAGLLQSVMRLDSRWGTTLLSDPHTSADEPIESVVAAAMAEAGEHTVDWLPRWSTRIAAIASAAPEMSFVYVVRDPRYAVSSGTVAWRSGRFITEQELEGWWGEKWSFPLVPEWQSLIGQPLHQVVATQWLSIASSIRGDLAGLDPSRVAVVTYEELVNEPEAVLERLVEHFGLAWQADIPDDLPLSSRTITAPNPSRALADIAETLPGLQNSGTLHTEFLAWAEEQGFRSYREQLVFDERPALGGETRSSADTPFQSGHTRSFVDLLTQAKSSLILTTYKSGHLIVARANEGRLDTAITQMNRPMGVATAANRMAVGTADAIHTYANHAVLGANLKGARPHDAVFVPRVIAFTGDVQIHEMDYDRDGQLWFVNTRFSCLCTLDLDSSFTPRWRPEWISSLAAEDRCHLNGMAMVDGRPKYVTALARTDTPNGWREHKGTSGVIVDIDTNEVIVEGLAMPHSPRVHDGHLWVLESGKGELVRIDLATKERTTVGTVPGFSRGLAFIGRYAVVGLSQVRESVFAGLPVTQTAAERNCGAWIVDTQTGESVGQLKFSGVVQEIFDVRLLPGMAWPLVTSPGDLTGTAFSLSTETLAQLSRD